MELFPCYSGLGPWPSHPWVLQEQVKSRHPWLFVRLEGATSTVLVICILRLFSVSSSFLSETHCFYSPANLGVSLASLAVILIYIILFFVQFVIYFIDFLINEGGRALISIWTVPFGDMSRGLVLEQMQAGLCSSLPFGVYVPLLT